MPIEETPSPSKLGEGTPVVDLGSMLVFIAVTLGFTYISLIPPTPSYRDREKIWSITFK
jgi:hypothetical protein